MKLLRLIFILILAMAIPVEGWSSIRMGGMGGVVDQELMQMSGSMNMSADQGCCETDQDQQSSCKLGSACKICQVFPSTAFSATVRTMPLTVADVITFYPEIFLRAFSPSGLWRPPRSL